VMNTVAYPATLLAALTIELIAKPATYGFFVL